MMGRAAMENEMTDAEWRARVKQLAEDLGAKGKEHELVEKKRAIDQWKAWLHEDLDRGGKNAHKYSRLPQAWSPTVAVAEDWRNEGYLDDDDDDDGGDGKHVITSAPWNLLKAKRDELAGLWNATDEPFRYDWEDWEEKTGQKKERGHQHGSRMRRLPRITVEELRSAAKAFRPSTSSTFDGFHVKHFALLGDEGLATVAELLEVIEATGMWPSQVSLVTTPMIPKPKGGFRVIGLMPSLYRLWAKARRSAALEWEHAHHRSFSPRLRE